MGKIVYLMFHLPFQLQIVLENALTPFIDTTYWLKKCVYYC